MITGILEEEPVMETIGERMPAPDWEQYLFVLDEKLHYTPYLVCKSKKRFYTINVWTLTEKEDKWYASPRIMSQITSASARKKLTALAAGKPYRGEKAYAVTAGDGVVDLDDPNIPLETVLADCVVHCDEESFMRPSNEQLEKIRSRFAVEAYKSILV